MVSISALTLVDTPLIVIHPIKALPSHSTVPICSPDIEHLAFTRTFLAIGARSVKAAKEVIKRGCRRRVRACPMKMLSPRSAQSPLGESLALELERTRLASLYGLSFSTISYPQ